MIAAGVHAANMKAVRIPYRVRGVNVNPESAANGLIRRTVIP
jgi:hypothetical protein